MLLLLQIRNVLLDACNLQINVEPASPSSLSTISIDHLPSRLHRLSRYLSYLDPWTDDLPIDEDPPAAVTAVFDGTAYHSAHADATWLQSDEELGAPAGGHSDGLRVMFTRGVTHSADDQLLVMAKAAGDSSQPRPPRPISAKQALADLQDGELPRPVYRATRLKAVSGKAERKKREAFLSQSGMPRIGDVAHFPAFTEAQRARSIALLRGLAKLNDVVSFHQLDSPAAILVSDDRGLRRRCVELPHPPVVLGSSQFWNWLDWLPPEDEQVDGEETIEEIEVAE